MRPQSLPYLLLVQATLLISGCLHAGERPGTGLGEVPAGHFPPLPPAGHFPPLPPAGQIPPLPPAGIDEFRAARRAEVGKLPNDYMFRQRAHPDQDIRPFFRRRALVQARAMAIQAPVDLRRWELVGPTNIGGRITDLAIHPNDAQLYYVAAAEGGVLKTTDDGSSWRPLLDKAASLAVGAVTLDPSDPEIVWVGTGEVNPGGGSAAFPGVGVLRSDNGGKSWQHKGLSASRHIGRILVDPQDGDRVYVAAMGALYSTNPQRGLYRTLDGGESWAQVLAVNDSTGCIDVAMSPQRPDVLIAAMWERIRRPHSRRYGGPGCGVFRSTDGGDSWALLANGLPAPSARGGRIGVTVCESQPDIMYAIYADDIGYFDGVYKSTSGGDSWSRVNDSALGDMYSSYGWWFGNIRVDPTDPNLIIALGLELYRSTNGGSSWSSVGWDVHVDHHGLEFAPNDPDRVVLGNDGGVYASLNSGSSWTKRNALPVTQFYTTEIDASNPHRFYGGTQDNGTIRTLSGGLDDWAVILGGDGFQVRVDPTDPNYVYAEYQWGNFHRSTNGGNSFSWAMSGIGLSDRINWNAPIALDPSNPARVYFGTHRLYRSTNHASSWSAISGDLTKGDGGGNLTFGTLTTIAVSPVDGEYLYTGADDGSVYLSRTGGDTWSLVNGDLPDRWVTRVVADPDDPEIFFVTLSGFKWEERDARVYRTSDGGATWASIHANLPQAPVNALVVDPSDSSLLFVGTDVGVYVSENGGGAWRPLGRGMPLGVVMDLKLDEGTRTLAAATFGRSMWKLGL